MNRGTDLQADPTLALARCVSACFTAAERCLDVANACLAAAERARLGAVIRITFDCSDLCLATGRVLFRCNAEERLESILLLCAAACAEVSEACSSPHSPLDPEGSCAEACRTCAAACEVLLARLTLRGAAT
ncbi:MAG: four-helix bundle copper-binding protein [Archangiaceae bacterium]|nr:four-helix bundle copper-binding protein [Archangiaceae bacterium]